MEINHWAWRQNQNKDDDDDVCVCVCVCVCLSAWEHNLYVDYFWTLHL